MVLSLVTGVVKKVLIAGGTAAVVMMLALCGLRLVLGCLVLSCLVLQILLESSEVLLRCREVARLQILRKLIESLGDGIVVLRRQSGTALGHELLQAGKTRLCRR